MNMAGYRNILLIQLGDIGDVVLTTPTIRAVKEAFPDASVSILVRKSFGSLLAIDPNIHEVVESEKYRGSLPHIVHEYVAFARRLRQARYDLVIDLRTGDRGAIFSFFTGSSVRIGRQGTKNQFWHKIFFSQIIRNLKIAPPPVHPGADQSLRVVREIDIDTKDSTPRLYIAPTDKARAMELLAEAGVAAESAIVTINPFSRWKYKEWSNAKWGAVIDRIWEVHRIPSVLIGSSEEAPASQEIVAGREEYAISLAGKTSLGELAAIISMSRLHLGVDSAAPHIAAALGTPTVTIHGPTDWRAWRVVDEKNRIVSSKMDCLPCNMMGCDGCGKSLCLDELYVDPVAQASLEVLELLE
jgi:predicted lipopolysaccharide heptosyltransferase III